ncbi:MAG: hypothetical protein ACC661_03825, partial [Verrucomicrobiales bacterium]
QPGSDILALMVLEHQVEMHNRLNRARGDFLRTLHRQKQILRAFAEQPSAKGLTGSALIVANHHADKILEHLLFCDEVELVDGGIEGMGDFREAFLANRRDSSEGRSLKDFQLLNRLFKYRCSYMIYSSAFRNLPSQLKAIVYRRLFAILTGRDTSPEYLHLSDSERGRILAILLETMDDLPAYWRS